MDVWSGHVCGMCSLVCDAIGLCVCVCVCVHVHVRACL